MAFLETNCRIDKIIDMKITLFFIIIFITLIFGCDTQKEKITKSEWKYGEGYHIGDWLKFDSIYLTIDDTGRIFRNGKFIATVKNVNIRYLEILSKKNQIGYYHNKSNTNPF